jgi:hypothetical protein
MKSRTIVRFALPAAAVATAAVLVTPPSSRAYTLLGHSLSTSFRSVRVFNNFTDAGANNNNVPDANFPGALGAVLAIWKGCAEWNSGLHNLNGNGDPHQLGTLGSGGSNFEISWQGEANEVGDPDEQIVSEIIGSNMNVLAYTEGSGGGPGSGGWRIRFYSNWTWADGPGTSIIGEDIQGIACHEYGHALGLDHSANSNATMYAFASGNGVSGRSINSDDQNGIQAIYFATDNAVKPKINSISGPGPTITITGLNFSLTDNEVWFTQAYPALNNTAVKVTNVPSNGTSITVSVPAGAGPGEIQVKKGGVGGPKALSNSLAITPIAGCNGNIVNYCTPGITTNFCTAFMSATGTPAVSSTSGFVLTCSTMEGQKAALIFYGNSGRASNVWAPGSSSFLCVKTPVQRTPSTTSSGTSGACDGSISIDWSDYIATHSGALGTPLFAGEQFNAQCWFRDPPAPGTTNLSDGIEWVMCP